MKIFDFGKKIGGAHKDLWKLRGLNEEDLMEMSDAERKKYVTRDNVWPLPDAKKQVEEGNVPVFVAYWQRQVRRAVRSAPFFYKTDNPLDVQKQYVQIVSSVRDRAMSVKTEYDMQDFYSFVKPYEDFREWRQCITPDLWILRFRHESMKRKMIRSKFPYGTKKSGYSRKGRFVPPQLEHIEREGRDYRHGKNVTPQMWQTEFDFYGVEFGNWTSQKDRLFSLNYCFDALLDLSDALDIDEKDIAFQGKLSLAFGARGRSGASAHYEPLRKVINLTKYRGAGSTAHEWFHALDHQIAEFYGVTDTILASESKQKEKLPGCFNTLIQSLKKDSMGYETDFFRGSKSFDKTYARDHFGYWASDSEMAARAFACYIKDVLGFKSDYLIAHADCYEF